MGSFNRHRPFRWTLVLLGVLLLSQAAAAAHVLEHLDESHGASVCAACVAAQHLDQASLPPAGALPAEATTAGFERPVVSPDHGASLRLLPPQRAPPAAFPLDP